MSTDRATAYARDVVEKRIVAGPLVRRACLRHLNDLEHGDERGLYYDELAAEDSIAFFETILCFYDGEHAGEPFVLQPWQTFIVGSLFGWKTEDGYRRFRTAYVEIGKGNGKSPLAAGIGLLGLIADGEPGAEIYSAASVKDQAKILFRDAEEMVKASPELSEIVTSNVNNLAVEDTASFFRPISSEKRGLDGKRVHMALIDELHEHPSAIVVNKMRAGTKGRRQALIFEITNSGYDRHSICWQHHEFSRQVLEGVLHNDTWFAYVCGLDEGDDWRDPAVWPKANPNLGVSIGTKYLKEQVDEAAGMPANENIVKRLNFCIWTEHAERWIDMAVWDKCKGEIKPEELLNHSCFGGLDLALTRDISALVLVFPPQAARAQWAILPYFWIPDADIIERSERDHVPYDLWAREGLVCRTPGNVSDHDFIEKTIVDLRPKYQIKEIAYDRALAAQLVTHLIADGLTMVPFAQGPLSMNSGVKTIEKLILGSLIANASNPVMRWMASNAVTIPDSNGNVKFDKARSTGRIDGMVALAMAIARAAIAAPAAPAGKPRISVL